MLPGQDVHVFFRVTLAFMRALVASLSILFSAACDVGEYIHTMKAMESELMSGLELVCSQNIHHEQSWFARRAASRAPQAINSIDYAMLAHFAKESNSRICSLFVGLS